jgi:hypothetical protein
MKRISHWKAVIVVAILTGLIAIQPVITYAGGCGGAHPGC